MIYLYAYGNVHYAIIGLIRKICESARKKSPGIRDFV